MALRRLRLAQRRKALGHSQDDLAVLVGVDRTTVVRWERAETEPQPWLRRKLAKHLRVTPEELSELLEAVSDVPCRGDGYTLLSSVPDYGLPGAAQRYYMLALHACRETGPSALPLRVKVIGDMTQLSTALGNYDDSLNLAQTGLYALPRSSNELVRAELLGLESRAYAQLGDREARDAARSAEACVEVWQEAPDK